MIKKGTGHVFHPTQKGEINEIQIYARRSQKVRHFSSNKASPAHLNQGHSFNQCKKQFGPGPNSSVSDRMIPEQNHQQVAAVRRKVPSSLNPSRLLPAALVYLGTSQR